MSVVYVAHEFPARSQTFVVAEADALSELGVNVRLYALRPGRGARDRAHVVTLSKMLGFSFLMFWRRPFFKLLRNLRQVARMVWMPPNTLRRRLRSVKALVHALAVAAYVDSQGESVHVRAHFFGLMSEVAILAGFLTRRPITVSIAGHAADVAKPASRTRLRFEVESVDFVTCASEFVLRSLYENCGEVGHAEVVRCGVQHRARAEVLRDASVVRIMTVARLVDKKGIDDCIQACRILAEDCDVGIRWTVIGGGPELERLRNLADSLGLADRFELTGELDNSSVLAELSERCDVFVLPSRIGRNGDVDGIPVALMEAMSMAVPVITTNVGGISELVHNERTGFVVPERSPADIAATVKRLLKSRPSARVVGQNGRDHVLQEFAVEKNAARLQSLIAAVDRARG